MLIKGGFIDTNRIIADIDTEISKLQQVRALLSNAARKKSPGRPKSTEPQVTKFKKDEREGKSSNIRSYEGSLAKKKEKGQGPT